MTTPDPEAEGAEADEADGADGDGEPIAEGSAPARSAGGGGGGGGGRDPHPRVEVPADPALEILDGSGQVISARKTVVIGQRVDLSVRVRGGGEVTGIRWRVPGDSGSDPERVKAYRMEARARSGDATAADHGASSSVELLSDDDLSRAAIHFCWVAGGFNRTVEVAGTVDGEELGARAELQIVRPTVNSFTLVCTAVGIFRGNYLLSDAPAYLACFSSSVSRSDAQRRYAGCRMDASVTAPAGIDGEGRIMLVQLCRTSRTYDWDEDGVHPWRTSSFGHWWLDDGLRSGTVHYGSHGEAALAGGQTATLYASDSPCMSINGPHRRFVVEESFRHFLMYKPPGDDAIWVTLKQGSWGWTADTRRDGAAAEWSTPVGSMEAVRTWDSAHLPRWTGQITFGYEHQVS